MLKEAFVKGTKLTLFQGGIPVIKRDGYFALSDNGDFVPHITVKDSAVHPEGWTDCNFEFGYRSWDEDAVLHIAFGKPFATFAKKTAKCELTVSRTFIAFGEVKTMGKADSNGTVIFDIKNGILTVTSGDMTFSASVNNEELKGYCEFSVSGGRVEMDSFEIHRTGCEPVSEEEHYANLLEFRKNTLDKKEKALEELEKYISENPEALPSKACDIIVPSKLVDAGKKMTVTFINDSPNGSVTIEHNCFSPSTMPEAVYVEWKEKDGRYVCEIPFTFDIPGNTKIILWTENTRLVRQVAVLGEGYSAVIPWIGTNIPYVDHILHRYDLPGDYWFRPIGVADDPENYIKTSYAHLKNAHLYGDHLVMTANGGLAIIPQDEEGTLYGLDKNTQKRGLEQMLRCLKIMGVTPEIVASYTPDYYAIDVLEENGVKVLNSLVNWQNCDDGDWIINHCGIPSQPYYPARDNFRRNGEKRKIMGFPQGNSSYDRNYSIMAFDGCPSNVMPGQRYFENRVLHHHAQRFFDAFDGYLTDCKNCDDLTTITVCIEAFRGFSDWSAVNEMALQYVVQKASTEKIVFTSAADVADYHQEKSLPLQKAYFYQPDVYYGYHNADLPGHIPDRLEAETPEYLAVISRGDTVPTYLYDYTVPWADEEDHLPRTEFGVIPPEQFDHATAIPPQLIRTGVQIVNTLEGNTIKVKVTSPEAKNRMVTGVFDIPFEKDFAFKSETAQCTKLFDRFTGNSHLFIDLGSIPAGESEYTITLEGTPRTPVCNESLKGLLGAKWFGNHAYLRSTERNTALYAEIKAPDSAYIVGQDGVKITPENGVLKFTVNTAWSDEAPLLYGYPQQEFEKNLESAIVENKGATTCYPWAWIDWT